MALTELMKTSEQFKTLCKIQTQVRAIVSNFCVFLSISQAVNSIFYHSFQTSGERKRDVCRDGGAKKKKRTSFSPKKEGKKLFFSINFRTVLSTQDMLLTALRDENLFVSRRKMFFSFFLVEKICYVCTRKKISFLLGEGQTSWRK